MINTFPKCRVFKRFGTVKEKVSFGLDFHVRDVLVPSDDP